MSAQRSRAAKIARLDSAQSRIETLRQSTGQLQNQLHGLNQQITGLNNDIAQLKETKHQTMDQVQLLLAQHDLSGAAMETLFS